MLRKINAGTVVSDDGFSIRPSGLEAMQYQAGDKIAIVEWACEPRTRKIRVYVTEVPHWEVPYGVKITDIEKNLMKENISKAMALLDDEFEII